MAMTQDPHSQFITHLNGQTTHFIVDDFTDPWKPKQTILIQPGFGRHAAFWYHWIPALARHYRVIRRDLRGHAYSSCPGPEYDYSLETVLGEIVDLLDQLKLDKVHVLGESTGGMVMTAFAAKHTHRCLSLTTCATPTHIPESAVKWWSHGHKDWPTCCRELGSRGYMMAVATGGGGVGQPDEDYMQWWSDQVAISPAEGFARYAEFLEKLEIRPFFKEIQESKLPVLILAPTKSLMTPLEDQKKQRDAMKGCTFCPIDGYGHEIFVDKAEDCQKALLQFLDRIKSGD